MISKICDFRHRALLVFVALLSIGSLSCRDQERVNAAQAFSSVATNFNNSTNDISNDIYFSCIRRAGYFNIDLIESRENRETVLQSCESANRPASMLAKDSSSIVIDYMLAIGKVANVNINTSEDLNRIKAALSSEQNPLFSIDSNSLDAGVGIVNFLLDLAIRRTQVNDLQLAIVCSDDSIQNYSTGLSDAFQVGYVDGILTDERIRMDTYYSDRATLMLSSGAEQIDFQVLENDLASDTEKIIQRQRAGESYIALIEKTAQSHSELKEIFSDGEEVTDEQCDSYFEGQVGSAQSITQAEKKEVYRIVEDYQKETELLLKNFEEAWPD